MERADFGAWMQRAVRGHVRSHVKCTRATKWQIDWLAEQGAQERAPSLEETHDWLRKWLTSELERRGGRMAERGEAGRADG